ASAARHDILHHAFQRVESPEQHVENGAAHRQLPVSHQIQHVLHLVGERCQIGKTYGGGHPFQGVGGTENALHDGQIVRVLLELQQIVVHRLQMLFRLVRSEEHTSELQSRENLVC